jgi:hypothetical protein
MIVENKELKCFTIAPVIIIGLLSVCICKKNVCLI